MMRAFLFLALAFAATLPGPAFEQIRSGELHPQRIPPEYWRHRVRMCKAMGLNTIGCYFFWNGIEGVDVAGFLRICQEEGMKVLLRPGPYCCGEWDFGGLPVSMLKDDITIRSSQDPRYLAAVETYLAWMAEQTEPFLAKNGGPIIMVQLDNEYGSWPDKEPGYPVWLKDFWKARGFGPFYMADGPGDNFFERLPYPDAEINVGLDAGMCEADWACAEKWNPGVFIFSSETYPGWLRHWGEGNWAPNDLRETLKWYMSSGKSFNLYLAHGGTTFGFKAGANDGGAGGYEPDVTSYDYASPINEQGRPTKEYDDYRAIIFSALGEEPPPVPEPIPAMAIPAFTPVRLAPLDALFASEPLVSDFPLYFEAFDQDQGMARYETTIPAGDEATLTYGKIADYAHISLDGVLLATVDRRLGGTSVRLPARGKEARLTIDVEAMGHINYGRGMKTDRKGLVGDVCLDGRPLKGWRIYRAPLTPEQVCGLAPLPGADGKGGVYEGVFTLDRTADTFIDMSKWTKGTLYVNGRNLGRYWNIGPQLSLFCPASWLKVGENRIRIVEMEESVTHPIRGSEVDVVSSNARSTGNLNNVWPEDGKVGTYCNPMPLPDIPISRNCREVADESVDQFRELADPSLLVEDGVLYVYPSDSMAWKSTDGGASWTKIDIGLEDVGYAPTVVRHKGAYLLCAGGSDLYRADSPEGPFVSIGHLPPCPEVPFDYNDPMLFSDNGRLFLYFGCTPVSGIWGVELDAEDPTKLVSPAKQLVVFEPERESWESLPDNRDFCWIEGAWMVRVGDRYCLTYSAAGTEHTTYAMGAAWGDDPMGPFVKQAKNPFFRKTKGVVTGTGHGSVVPVPGKTDEFFVTYSVLIGVCHNFERLIGIDRIRLDETGAFAVSEATETPQFTDGSGRVPWYPVAFSAEGWREVSDDSLRTWKALPVGESLALSSSYTSYVRAMRLVWHDLGVNAKKGVVKGPYRYRLEGRLGDEAWRTLVDAAANDIDLQVDYREIPRTLVDEVRLSVVGAPDGVTPAVAELTVFGE